MLAILNQLTVLNTYDSLSSFFFSFFFLFFLLSFFSFKLSALLSQVSGVKHKCLSFFFPFFLLSFLFFSLYFSFFYLRKHLSPPVHLRWKKQIFSVSFFPFLNIYIYNFQYFWKGRRKNSFKLYLSFRRVYFAGSFLLRASDIPLRIGWVSLSADYCPKILFYAFYGAFSQSGL